MTPDLQSVLDAVLDGVIVLDEDARVAHINSEACRIVETSAESVLGAEVERLVSSDHPIAVLSHKVLRTARPAIHDEAVVERRFAGDLVVDVAISPLQDEGELSGAVIALRDRTIRNSLRELVSEREQLSSYGHIAAGIAHEVKNPLSGIRGAAELLERRVDDERSRNTAALIVREVDRITDLVDELMVFAKGEKIQRQTVNIHQILDNVLQLLAMDPLGEQIESQRYYDPSIPEIQADPDRLTQVFLNLGRNALQAMEGKRGALNIATRMTLHHRLTDSHGTRVPTVEVTFEDTGPGIEPEVLKELATPFFTTKSKGTGLGLAVSRHWIARHDGNLRIASEPGIGTLVRVTLPLKPLKPLDP